MQDFLKREWRRVNDCALACDGCDFFPVPAGTTDADAMELVRANELKDAKTTLDAFVTGMLDSLAQSLGYKDFDSAVGWRGDELFGSQADALFLHRTAVWKGIVAIQDAVMAGARPIPNEKQLTAELPVFKG